MLKYICVLCLLMAVVFADHVKEDAVASSGNSGIELLDTAESANPEPQFFGGFPGFGGGYGGYGGYGEKIDAL